MAGLLDSTLEQVDDSVAEARQALQQGPAPAGAGPSGTAAGAPAGVALLPASVQAAAGAPQPHPLQQRLEGLQYPAWQLARGEARPPHSHEDTPFTFIDTVPALRAAAQRLAAARELAVDLEAHSYRSFQVC